MQRLKIGAYIRVSTEEQASLIDGSLDNQKFRINSFVETKITHEKEFGEIVQFYVDDGYSAKDMKRPAFQKMMGDLERGRVDLILVADLSRLSRSISDFCQILEILKGRNASFLSIKEQFDTTTPMGKMMLYSMINMAQFEREQTAERVALGCHARALRGLLNGGQEILGFDKSPEKKNTYLINESESEAVRTIFGAYLEQGTLGRTITHLERIGIRPKIRKNRKQKIADRGLWTVSTLASVLKNPAYIGVKEVNAKFKNVDPKFLKPYQQYSRVKASWPAIVDDETFESVQRQLDENHRLEKNRIRNGERRIFLASGILRCKECGRAMVGQSAHGAKKLHRYYAHAVSKGEVFDCSIKRINADEVEAVLSRHLTEMLTEGNYLGEVAKRVTEQKAEVADASKATRTRLQKELRQAEREIEATFRLNAEAADDAGSSKLISDTLKRLARHKTDLENELAKIENSVSDVISSDDRGCDRARMDEVLGVPETTRSEALGATNDGRS